MGPSAETVYGDRQAHNSGSGGRADVFVTGVSDGREGEGRGERSERGERERKPE